MSTFRANLSNYWILAGYVVVMVVVPRQPPGELAALGTLQLHNAVTPVQVGPLLGSVLHTCATRLHTGLAPVGSGFRDFRGRRSKGIGAGRPDVKVRFERLKCYGFNSHRNLSTTVVVEV